MLKCNHGSGENVICKDKSQLDTEKVRKQMRKWLKRSFYKVAREWAYKDVPRRILAEKYMTDESGTELKDYKVFNFNGEPEIIQVDFDRFIEHKRNMYGKDWKRIEMELEFPSDKNKVIPRPESLEEMLYLARKLSEGLPHVRTDFYCINGKLYFGELTLYHGGGYEEFRPDEWDKRLGELMILPPPHTYLIKNQGFILLVKIKAEQKQKDLRDYKFFCFNGAPRLCQVISDRNTDEKIDFYDMDWKRLIGLIGLIGLNPEAHNSDEGIECPRSSRR